MSPPSISTLISSTTTTVTTALFPQTLPNQSSSLPTTRRVATGGIILTSFASLITFLRQPPVATAFSLGISGPKDWLRDQKKKAAKYLLAPIYASRNTLQAAYQLISTGTSPEKDLEEVQRLLISASRDCIPQERNSIVTFQSNTGVEVCTFKLVLKNAASLLDDKDPIKLVAEAKLSDLERSFSSLNSVANGTTPQLDSDRFFQTAPKCLFLDYIMFCEPMSNHPWLGSAHLLNKPDRHRVFANQANLSEVFSSKRQAIWTTQVSFQKLRQKVADALMDTISSLNNFEQGIKDCLEI